MFANVCQNGVRFAVNEWRLNDMAANTLASLKEQQHVEFEALTVFATDGHSCFCRYLGAVKGISSKHKFLIRVPVR